MEQKIMTLLARTPVHVGAGNSVGAVDAPVMRERHTRIPIIPGTSLKGVLSARWCDKCNMKRVEKRDKMVWQRIEGSDAEWLFGQETDREARAGALLVGEARVLAFPVRSAKNGFAWLTCPLVLNRFKRDAGAGFTVPRPDSDDHCFAAESVVIGGRVILEEYCYTVSGQVDDALAGELKDLSDDAVWSDLASHLVVVTDGIFSHFVEQACEVVTRVRIDDDTGTVAEGALFNQEQVPSETLFYAAIDAQQEKTSGEKRRSATEALETLKTKLDADPVLQVGGDETTGLGFCSTKLI